MFYAVHALILDGNSEIGAHVRSNLCYLICLRHLIRPRAVGWYFILSEKTYLPSYVRNRLWVTFLCKHHVYNNRFYYGLRYYFFISGDLAQKSIFFSHCVSFHVGTHGTILDGNSEIGAHAVGEIGDLICFQAFDRSRAVAN